MNFDEKLVYDFLQTTYDKVIYEPRPNKTPDFLVDDELAIEVTRLNEKIKLGSGKVVDLEGDWHSSMDKLVVSAM